MIFVGTEQDCVSAHRQPLYYMQGPFAHWLNSEVDADVMKRTSWMFEMSIRVREETADLLGFSSTTEPPRGLHTERKQKKGTSIGIRHWFLVNRHTCWVLSLSNWPWKAALAFTHSFKVKRIKFRQTESKQSFQEVPWIFLTRNSSRTFTSSE